MSSLNHVDQARIALFIVVLVLLATFGVFLYGSTPVKPVFTDTDCVNAVCITENGIDNCTLMEPGVTVISIYNDSGFKKVSLLRTGDKCEMKNGIY